MNIIQTIGAKVTNLTYIGEIEMFGVVIALTVLSIVIYRTADISLSHETCRPEIDVDIKIQELSTKFVQAHLGILADQANREGTEVICRYSDISNYVHIAEELKPEIEQKYDVTILPYYDGYHITPNGNYKNEYWS